MPPRLCQIQRYNYVISLSMHRNTHRASIVNFAQSQTADGVRDNNTHSLCQCSWSTIRNLTAAAVAAVRASGMLFS